MQKVFIFRDADMNIKFVAICNTYEEAADMLYSSPIKDEADNLIVGGSYSTDIKTWTY